MSTGIVLGIGGVLAFQRHYLPPRLSAAESAGLRSAFQQADAERLRLRSQLAESARRLDAAVAQHAAATQDAEAARGDAARLSGDVAALLDALPPDPRGGRVEVRAGQFSTQGAALVYDLVLTRKGPGTTPMAGVLQMTVSGDAARGAETTVTAQPVAFTLGSHAIVHGNIAMPEGFKPRDTTIRILDRPAGEQLGMRMLRVR